MPNSTSAKKRQRQNQKRRARNRSSKSRIRNQVKLARKHTASYQDGKATAAEVEEVFRLTWKILDQGAARGIIHRNKAARDKRRLSKSLKEANARTGLRIPVVSEKATPPVQGNVNLRGKPLDRTCADTVTPLPSHRPVMRGLSHRLTTSMECTVMLKNGSEEGTTPGAERKVTLSVWPASLILLVEMHGIRRSFAQLLEDVETLGAQSDQAWCNPSVRLLSPRPDRENEVVDLFNVQEAPAIAMTAEQAIDSFYRVLNRKDDDFDEALSAADVQRQDVLLVASEIGDLRFCHNLHSPDFKSLNAVMWLSDTLPREVERLVLHFSKPYGVEEAILVQCREETRRLVRNAVTLLEKHYEAT